ncbi:MAG: hypothetical protein ABSD57_08275 [Verrucomicrobiota bacterium]|jgi:hypothetical protein
MNPPNHPTPLPPPLNLSRWQNLPVKLMTFGALISLIGFFRVPKEFAFSWLLAFMFYLTIALGALFLVLIHHLTDAGWSVATRRFCEHIAALLFPWLAVLFVPVAVLAPQIYPWVTIDPHTDRVLMAKWPLFTLPGFYVVSASIFGVWWLLTSRLRYWSLKQDETGGAHCTHRMRYYSGWGILAFAATVTLSGIIWMQALQYQMSSTIYGICFFADCAWVMLATAYVVAMILQRQRILHDVLHDNQFYYLGTLLFAFTLFHAYVHFAQYFVVWNGNLPEETFWYIQRERGSWWWVSMIIIFGHFLLPFFVLLPIRVKSSFKIMLPVCLWAWLMHFVDLSFNILPVAHPDGYPWHWILLQFGCLAFMGGLLSRAFLKDFNAHAPFPTKDPRLLEAMGIADAEIIGTQTTGGGR